MANDPRVKSPSTLKEIFGQFGLYGRSLGLFLAVSAFALVGYTFLQNTLHADAPLNNQPAASETEDNSIDFTLGQDGNLYLGNTRESPEVFIGDTTYRYRLQVISHPKETIDNLTIVLHLPKAATQDTVSYSLINNGGAATAESALTDPQTITYTAGTITPQTELAIQFEVPKSFVEQSIFFSLEQKLSTLPSSIWLGISIALPAVTLLLLLLVSMARFRQVKPVDGAVTDPPSRLTPALLGILLKGRLTSRELAATLIDLARRGHLVIHQTETKEYRFRRQAGGDRLEDYEYVLLEQIFGPASEATTGQEISFAIAQELFSRKVSEAFILAYRKINDLGYFYTNPLTLHKRYQFTGISLFLLGLVGFLVNILLFADIRLSLLFWLGMIVSALLIILLAQNLPSRTIYGDRELSRWLAFQRYLVATEPVNFVAHSQEKYLAYLPYAIIFECETEWTRRFYNLPFVQPAWYVASGVTTIEEFTTKIFPLFGYLSHALSLTAQPATR